MNPKQFVEEVIEGWLFVAQMLLVVSVPFLVLATPLLAIGWHYGWIG